MEIKFSNFANMGAVNIEFTDKINLLAGDNGSGKTLLLEAYSKANDILLEILESKDNIISKTLETIQFNIILDNIDEYRNNDFEDSSSNYNFTIKVTEFSQESRELFSRFKKELTQKIEESIESKVLYDRLTLSNLEINLGELEDYFLIDEKVEISFINDSIFKNENYLLLMKTDDREQGRFLNSESLQELYKLLNSLSNKTIISTNNTEDFDLLLKYFKILISDIITDKFITKNKVNNITYIPSERIYSMSKRMEKLFSENSFLRYSEQKFMTKYLDSKESRRMSAIFDDEEEDTTSKQFKDLLGGTLKFDDDDSDAVSIVDNFGAEIPRELFSTKQNKLHSLSILEQPFLLTRRRNLTSDRMLIFEEPEAHLSIKSIFQMFNYILKLSETYKIVISTHSEIMLNLINNWYLTNVSENSIQGWEILDREENSTKHIFRRMELADYGLISEFINQQLQILQEQTYSIQTKNLDVENYDSQTD
ncbi:hypothetical protein HCC14_07685 [Streptococcus suis]|nr:hypothetical protein [Streptococcus suis]